MRVALFGKFVALAAVIAIAGCAVGRASTVGGEAGVRRAALARIVVDNRTGEAIDVAFLTVADPGREVVVGGVAARSTALVAPVLAGEPIVLVARTASGAEPPGGAVLRGRRGVDLGHPRGCVVECGATAVHGAVGGAGHGAGHGAVGPVVPGGVHGGVRHTRRTRGCGRGRSERRRRARFVRRFSMSMLDPCGCPMGAGGFGEPRGRGGDPARRPSSARPGDVAPRTGGAAGAAMPGIITTVWARPSPRSRPPSRPRPRPSHDRGGPGRRRSRSSCHHQHLHGRGVRRRVAGEFSPDGRRGPHADRRRRDCPLLFAIWFAQQPATPEKTYGLRWGARRPHQRRR